MSNRLVNYIYFNCFIGHQGAVRLKHAPIKRQQLRGCQYGADCMTETPIVTVSTLCFDKVTILEASGRVGGRVETYRDEKDGWYAELGAMRIPDSHK